jgi:predicted PurR-regulated permease PerM
VLAPLLDSLKKALENFTTQGQVQPANVEVTIYSLSSQLASKLGTLVDILGPVFAVVVSTIFTLIMAFQMSLAANQISDWYPDLIPPAYKSEYAALFDKISQTWISFLRGQLTLMLIIGTTIWIGDLVLGVPAALLMGVLSGLLELIPNIGPTLAAIPAVLLALIFGSTHLPIDNVPFALLVVGFYVLVQLLENQFIVPYVMGDAVDLPPLIVLIGTIAGASAFGILGALLATPIIATGNLVFRFIYRKILEPPPLPEPADEKPSIWESVKGWVRKTSLNLRKKQSVGAAGTRQGATPGTAADVHPHAEPKPIAGEEKSV